jgi:benzylsuccinate CoA-transferase BbsF subunit
MIGEPSDKKVKSKSPLSGVKVASFCWMAAGPLTARYLGMWGATVVRIESHTRPDLVRLQGPYRNGEPGVDNNAWFPAVNSSCYSASINIQTPKGKELAWKLIRWADVVASSFSPGQMEKWGLGYEEVRKVNPEVIYYRSSQLGASGPNKTRAGSGYEAAAMAGFTHISGWPDRGPVPYTGAYTDFKSPRFGAAAILAALAYRRRTGKGQEIDESQAESASYLLAPVIMDYFANGRIYERQGNALPYASPHAFFPCKGDDCWCAIAVFSDTHWKDLCRITGNPEWSEKEQYRTLLGRKQWEDEIYDLVAQWTRIRTAEEVESLLTASGIPASVVESTSYLIENDSHLKTRGFFRNIKHTVIGDHINRGPAFKFSRSEDCQFSGPALGEHNEYVFKELLGMTNEEMAEGIKEGGITTNADLPPMKGAF